ncbi:hypothetical protein Tco_0531189 [Tanacetum coccineum]
MGGCKKKHGMIKCVSEMCKNVKSFARKSLVGRSLNEFLRSSLGDSLHKVLRRHIEEHKQELKPQESQKSASKIIKIKQEHASKQNWPKHSATPFDITAVNELFKMMMASKSYEKHLAHKELYDALIQSLFVDEDDMDKAAADVKKRPRKDTQPSKKSSTSKESSKGKTPPKTSKFGKSLIAKELDVEHVHDMSMNVEENNVDEMCNANEQPDGEWNKCQVVDDQPEQTWFNDLVSDQKDPLTFYKLMDTPFDFSKFAKNRLKLDKITKEVLTNHEGDRCPFDLKKPLPLKGCPCHLTVPVEYFFNKDLEYLKSENMERNYTTSIIKTKATRILSVVSVKVNKLHGYGYLEEIVVSVESYQKKLNITKPQKEFLGIFSKELYTPSFDPPGVVYEDLNNRKRLMRADELYKFSDRTLKKMLERQILKNLER